MEKRKNIIEMMETCFSYWKFRETHREISFVMEESKETNVMFKKFSYFGNQQ